MVNELGARGSRIIVGVDGSASSKQALRWAAYFAATSGATIEAVGSWEYPVNMGWSAVANDLSLAVDMHKAVTGTVDEVFGADRPAGLEIIIQEGHPVSVLLHRSAGAFMLVVGSRGHGGFAALLLGSVSAAVAEHATCPVVVVHGDTNPPGEPS